MPPSATMARLDRCTPRQQCWVACRMPLQASRPLLPFPYSMRRVRGLGCPATVPSCCDLARLDLPAGRRTSRGQDRPVSRPAATGGEGTVRCPGSGRNLAAGCCGLPATRPPALAEDAARVLEGLGEHQQQSGTDGPAPAERWSPPSAATPCQIRARTRGRARSEASRHAGAVQTCGRGGFVNLMWPHRCARLASHRLGCRELLHSDLAPPDGQKLAGPLGLSWLISAGGVGELADHLAERVDECGQRVVLRRRCRGASALAAAVS